MNLKHLKSVSYGGGQTRRIKDSEDTKTFEEWYDLISTKLEKSFKGTSYLPHFAWNTTVRTKGKEWVKTHKMKKDEFVEYMTKQTGLPFHYESLLNKWLKTAKRGNIKYEALVMVDTQDERDIREYGDLMDSYDEAYEQIFNLCYEFVEQEYYEFRVCVCEIELDRKGEPVVTKVLGNVEYAWYDDRTDEIKIDK